MMIHELEQKQTVNQSRVRVVGGAIVRRFCGKVYCVF